MSNHEKEVEGEEKEREDEREKLEGRENEEKREESERFRAPSGGLGGVAGGRPRRRPRGGGGGGGGGMEANDGSPERKTATSRGCFHKSKVVSGVGWRGQSNKCATLWTPMSHSGQALLVERPILC